MNILLKQVHYIYYSLYIVAGWMLSMLLVSPLNTSLLSKKYIYECSRPIDYWKLIFNDQEGKKET